MNTVFKANSLACNITGPPPPRWQRHEFWRTEYRFPQLDEPLRSSEMLRAVPLAIRYTTVQPYHYHHSLSTGARHGCEFVILKGASGQFHFNLKAGNGEVILSSQMYAAKAGAQGGIESVKVNSQEDARFERKKSKAGEPFFVLKAANGEILGKSEMYSSKSSMENGIASVMKNAPVAVIDDQA